MPVILSALSKKSAICVILALLSQQIILITMEKPIFSMKWNQLLKTSTPILSCNVYSATTFIKFEIPEHELRKRSKRLVARVQNYALCMR